MGRWWEAPGHEDGAWEAPFEGGVRVPGPVCVCWHKSKAAPGSEGRWLQVSRDLLKSLPVTNLSPGGDEAASSLVRAGLSSKGAALQRGPQPGKGHLGTEYLGTEHLGTLSTWALWAPGHFGH